MALVASRDLRNSTSSLLRRAAAGETITITVNGEPVADLVATNRRPATVSREELVRRLVGRQADCGLTAELAVLVGDTTDELGPVA